ncbi:MAG TPA: PfkB family carbohydrate kinase [Chloroflexota bacterium]|nr:PfkB family carbohydrate kinase [Chloroflexota bacterium]
MTEVFQEVLALLAEGTLPTDYGEFKMSVWYDGHEQAIVLSKGDLIGQHDVLCRIHSECISSHIFFSRLCDCRDQMIRSQKLISREGRGLIFFLEQEGRGNGAAAHVATLNLKAEGIPQHEAYRKVGFSEDIRQYDIVAKILKRLKINSVKLITSNRNKIGALEKSGIKISGTQDLLGEVITLGISKRNIQDYIEHGAQNSVIHKEGKKWVFVLGDLNIDYLISEKNFINQIMDKPEPVVGGTGFNAALAFLKMGFEPIVFGKIGDDQNGRIIQAELKNKGITSLIRISETKPTGNCSVIFIEALKQRWLIKEEQNANDYDLEHLRQALKIAKIGPNDFVFMVTHPLVRFGPYHTKKLLELISETRAKIILDVIPHNIYETINYKDFSYAVGEKANVIIGEFETLSRVIGHIPQKNEPDTLDWEKLLEYYKAQTLIVRYGIGNISEQAVCMRNKVVTGGEEQSKLEGDEIEGSKLIQLLDILTRYFDEGELRNLSFSLGINYQDIGGENFTDRARELITYLDRRKRLSELLNSVQRERPFIDELLAKPRAYTVVKESTGYTKLTSGEKRGFGDHLTAKFLSTYFDKI